MNEVLATPGTADKNEDTLIQLYWAILETWSAQVDSYWTRANYFAAFEIAAIAGTWVVLNAGDFYVGHWLLLLAIFLTASWIFSNVRSHDYVRYWWKVLEDIEGREEWKRKPEYVSAYEMRRKKRRVLNKLQYSFFTNWLVPTFFLIVWLFLLWVDWNGTTHRWTVPSRGIENGVKSISC
jgi:hypothetical protein